MKKYSIDLHCHTNNSDWTKWAEELIKEAKAIWLDFICASDHDILDESFALKAEKAGIQSCESSEISVIWHTNNEAHVIIYSNKINRRIINILNKTRQSRVDILMHKIDRLNDRTIYVDPVELLAYYWEMWIKPESISLRHLAKFIFSKKRNATLLKNIFWEEINEDVFVKEFLTEDWESAMVWWRMRCYFLPSIEDLTKNITNRDPWHIISLAHPEHTFKNTHELSEKISFYTDRWVNAIEICSNTPKNWVHTILKIRKDYDLILTIWSNCHWDLDSSRYGNFWDSNPEIQYHIIHEQFQEFKKRIT